MEVISLGYRIKEAREAAGISQTELALKSGVSRATIWALESNNEHVTTTKTLIKIGKALGVSLESLFSPNRSA